MRVLIAEDEERLAAAIARGLRREGMAVDLAPDGADRSHASSQARDQSAGKEEIEESFHLGREGRPIAVPPELLHRGNAVGVNIFDTHHFFHAEAAESWLAERVDWEQLTLPGPGALVEFAELVAGAARPIDDHRSTAVYRRHAVRVLAERAAAQAFCRVEA